MLISATAKLLLGNKRVDHIGHWQLKTYKKTPLVNIFLTGNTLVKLFEESHAGDFPPPPRQERGRRPCWETLAPP